MSNEKESEKLAREMRGIIRFYKYVGLGVLLFIFTVFLACLVTGRW